MGAFLRRIMIRLVIHRSQLHGQNAPATERASFLWRFPAEYLYAPGMKVAFHAAYHDTYHDIS